MLSLAVEIQRLRGENLAFLADLHGDGLPSESRGSEIHRNPRRRVLSHRASDLKAGDAYIPHFVGGAAQEGVDAQPVATQAASGRLRIQTLGLDAIGDQEHAGQGIF